MFSFNPIKSYIIVLTATQTLDSDFWEFAALILLQFSKIRMHGPGIVMRITAGKGKTYMNRFVSYPNHENRTVQDLFRGTADSVRKHT
jgi:hypothetical protein